MDVLDSEGRLFGVVNVVDALVVVVTVAVVVAGLALVMGGGPEPADGMGSTHVTLDLGTQPDLIAEALNEGDSYAPTGNSNLTITDVYLAPSGGGTHAMVRAELTGPTTDVGMASTLYAGAPPRLGRSLDIATATYNVTGRIRDVGGGPSLDTGDARVVVRATVPTETARMLSAGTPLREAGRTVATVRNVSVIDTGERTGDRTEVVVLADLRTYRLGETRFFATRPLDRGSSVTLPVGNSRVSGSVVALDPDDGLGKETREVLVTDTLDARAARALSVGDDYSVAGERLGTVDSVTVYGTTDPETKRVYVGLSLETTTYGGVARFGGSPLTQGSTVMFRTDQYDLDGTVVRLNATEQRGTATTRTATLRLSDVPPDRADVIQAGLAERAKGQTVARIVAVDRSASQVVLTSDSGDIFVRDHPLNEDLTLTTELTVRETATGIRFKGETIQPGSTVTLDLNGVTVQAQVVAL